jgi:hypothetical protein
LLGFFGDGRAFLLVGEVGGDGFDFGGGAVLLEVGEEVVHVLLFFLDVMQQKIGAFVCAGKDSAKLG